MDISAMEQVLKQCIKEHLTPLVWGKHGIGKSMIIKELGASLGYEVIDLRLGQLEVGDLIGMPDREYFCPNCKTKYGLGGNITFCPICKKKEDIEVGIVGRTIWLPPAWFPQNGEKRLIFFDELNRGRLDVQQATFQIVLDRRIHTHKIPDNCAIICACNPSGGDYYVEELDPALLDRFVNIKFTLQTKEWLNWAREHTIMPEIIDFIATDNKALGNEAVEIPIEIKPTPRSYEFMSKILPGIPKNQWIDLASCIIGEETAIAFYQSLKSDIEKPIKAADIFNNFAKVREKVKAQVEADEGNTRFDLLRETLDEIMFCLKEGKSKKYSEKQLSHLGDFLIMLPQDLGFSAFKDLATIADVNERLLLARPDLFDLLKKARGGDIK
jgi:hypothetical protein